MHREKPNGLLSTRTFTMSKSMIATLYHTYRNTIEYFKLGTRYGKVDMGLRLAILGL
jgi:hypothetical protein